MTSTTVHAPAAQTSRLVAAALHEALRRLAVLHRRRAARRQLESLTLEQLRDVGIDPDVISRSHVIPTNPWTMSRLMSLR
jgi:uncharacterized protein YjiS (DUF1127 family)